MHARVPAALAVAAAAAFTALPSLAEPGSAGFGATTSTTIAPGGSVTFEAAFTKAQDWFMSSFATPEPLPAVGEQTWLVSAESATEETLSSLSFDVWSTSGEGLGMAMPVAEGGPGTTVQNVWSFSLAFSQPGSYSVTLTGGWQSLASMSDTSMTGTRTCALDGGGVLGCSDWALIGTGGSALADTSGSFGPLTLTVQVVPEPATPALWLLGLAAVGGWLRRGRRLAAARPG